MNLVRRFCEGLSKYEHHAMMGSEGDGGVQKETMEALIDLSSHKFDIVTKHLLHTLIDYVGVYEACPSEEQQNSQLVQIEKILSLMLSCFSSQWNCIKKKYRDLEVENLDREAQMDVKRKEESLSPPPLEEKIAYDYVSYATKLLFHILPQKEQEPAKTCIKTISTVLFVISSSNFEAIFSNSQCFFGDLNDELSMQLSFLTLESLSLNSARLAEVMRRLAKFAGSIKKDALRVGFTRSLRHAIWSWIDHYPIEFVSFCKEGARHPGEPEGLFDTIDSWGSSPVKKAPFWPIQMDLLILMPDIFMQAAMALSEKKKCKKNVLKFLEHLEKGIESTKVADAVAICFVDICKASTFIPKESQSGVRHIIPRFEHELQERLFNPQKSEERLLNREVVVDCLLSFFRLSHRKVTKSLFADCLKPEFPPFFRLVLVECLLRIIQEGTPLPWNPSIADVYAGFSGSLRTLFRNLFQELLLQSTGVSTTSLGLSASENLNKKKNPALDNSQILTETLLKLIFLFNEDPELALHPSSLSSSSLKDLGGFIGGICKCSMDLSVENLAPVASKTLLRLHDEANIKKWAFPGSNLIETFWQISASVNECFSWTIMSRRDPKPADLLATISLIQEILKRRNEFLAFYGGDICPSSSAEKTRSSSLQGLESALLVLLCSGQMNILSKAITCFNHLCREAEIVDMTLEQAPTNTILMNIEIYSQMQVADYTSRKAQQKFLWTLFRRIQSNTKATFAAWEEVYRRWCSLSVNLLGEEEVQREVTSSRPGKRGNSEVVKEKETRDQTEVLQEWLNCTGFLAALSGLFMDVEKPLKVFSQGRLVASKGPVNIIETFLDQLVEHLVADNVNIRESVKLVLGSALAPAAYSTLFRHLLLAIRKHFGPAGQIHISDSSTLLVDQTISVMKLILESSPEDLSHVSDIEDLLLGILKFVGQLESKSPNQSIYITKSRLCGLLEAMMKQRQNINIRNEFSLRNELVESVIRWTSDSSTSNKAKIGGSRGEDASVQPHVQRLDLACLRALASLLKGLPLAGADDAAKSKQFSRLFTFFTELLTRCKKRPETALPELSEMTVECLSNMVTENIEHGLQYFVAMGYHDDIQTRPAFLNVLTNILKQGAKLDSDLDEKNKYDKLADLLLEPELRLLSAISDSCQITEADELSQVLVRFYHYRDRVMLLLRAAIREETYKTDTASTLFRRNSLATKLIVHFSREMGKQYIKDTIGSILRTLLAVKDSFEVDPAKLGIEDEEEAKKVSATNLERVRLLSQQFLDAIVDSLPNCPQPLCDICRFLTDVVGEKFPGKEHMAVCGFIFLRFFCPAVVAPEGFGLVTGTFSPSARRALLLATKSLQNLANKVYFGAKEPFMKPMNTFIESNISRIGQLCDSLASRGNPLGSSLPPLPIAPQMAEEDLQEIHRHLHRRFEAINKVLRSLPAPEMEGQKSIYDRFQTVMQQLGKPPEANKEQKSRGGIVIAPKAKKDDMLFANFMKRFESGQGKALLEEVRKKEVFYEGGRTKDAHPVFYFIASRYNPKFTACDLLLYHALKMLQPHFETAWHLVIDCTFSGPMQEMALDQFLQYDSVVPASARNSLQKIYVVNANSWVKKYAKRVFSRFLSQSTCKKLVFTTPRGLCDFMSEKNREGALPSNTLDAEADVKATFNHVMHVGAQFRKKEVTLLLGPKYMQTLSVKQHHILGHDSNLLDIASVSEIYELGASEDGHEVHIKHGSGQVLQFRSAQSRQIVQQLQALQDRSRTNRKKVRNENQLVRPSDVRGALLNMSLLNLGSNSIAVREAAYNLLATISQNFGFVIRTKVVEANGMYIPRYSAHFVLRLSEELAANHKELTLEFLLESFRALGTETDPSIRSMCLNYISPWLPNLLNCQSAEKDKAVEVLTALVTTTVANPAIAPSILMKEWTLLGGIPDLFDLVVEVLISFKANEPKSEKEMSVLQDIAMATSSKYPKLMFGKLIAHACNLLHDAHLTPSATLATHTSWPQICLAIRLILPLSFDALDFEMEHFLPEIFFVILMVFGSGSEDIREKVHELFVNCLHALYTRLLNSRVEEEGGEMEEEVWTHKVPQVMSEVVQLSFRLYFGISRNHGTSRETARIGKKQGGNALKETSLVHVEHVALAMSEVLRAIPKWLEVGTAGHCRLLSLISKTAFTVSSLQARGMVGLGVFCSSSEMITDDVFGGVLFALRGWLQEYSGEDETGDGVPTAVLMCLGRMYRLLPSTSVYFKPMFWVVMSLLQIGGSNILLPALTLLDVILKTLEDRGCFQEVGASNYLLSVREASLETELARMDSVTGISFKSNFSFATSAHLLQGFRHVQTKATTVRVLSTLVDLTANQTVGHEMLGYLAALLPIKGDEMSIQQLLILPAEDVSSPYLVLFTEQMIPDAKHGALLLSFLGAMLEMVESEFEQLFIYECLREGVKMVPEAVPVVRDGLVGRLNRTLQTSQNTKILKVVLKIMESMFTWGTSKREQLAEGYLKEIGFEGLVMGGKGRRDSKKGKELAKCFGGLLDRLSA